MTLAPTMRPEDAAAVFAIRTAPASVQEMIEQQRRMVQAQEFALELELHGRLDRVAFEVSRGGASGAHSRIRGRWRMFLELGGARNEAGGYASPMIAVSRDHEHLLVREPFPRRLPRVPDPNWLPETFPSPTPAPLVEQRWEDMASGRWDRFLVFQPLTQIIFLSSAGQFGDVLFMPAAGKFPHAALLVDAHSGEGFFIGGKLRLRMSG